MVNKHTVLSVVIILLIIGFIVGSFFVFKKRTFTEEQLKISQIQHIIQESESVAPLDDLIAPYDDTEVISPPTIFVAEEENRAAIEALANTISQRPVLDVPIGIGDGGLSDGTPLDASLLLDVVPLDEFPTQ